MASVADSTSFLTDSQLKEVPSSFRYINDPTALTTNSIPVVDFSALTHPDPDRRSNAIRDLAKACEEWSFFIMVNHGIGEELMDSTFTALKAFVDLPKEEKKQYEGKSATDPVNCGSFNSAKSTPKFTFWRENLKLHVHPVFHCPDKPHFLRDVVWEYTERTRKVARQLVEGISEGLQLEHGYVAEALGLESSFQIYAGNYYPPCPRPDQAIGISPHTDHGLLTLLIHNGVSGLQIENKGKWYSVDSPKNAILVNVGDNLESFTNGRYKTLRHRAVVNDKRERMSIVSGYGPSKEANFGPAAALVERDGRAKYPSIKYEDYVDWLLTKSRYGIKNPLFAPDDDAQFGNKIDQSIKSRENK